MATSYLKREIFVAERRVNGYKALTTTFELGFVFLGQMLGIFAKRHVESATVIV
jgi:hypothetical protein